MVKEWYSSNELIKIDGLPCTTQGINKRAKREQWVSRRRSGVQGKAIEYHIDSLPYYIRDSIRFTDQEIVYQKDNRDITAIWESILQQLNSHEQRQLITFIMRNGITKIINYINQADEE